MEINNLLSQQISSENRIKILKTENLSQFEHIQTLGDEILEAKLQLK